MIATSTVVMFVLMYVHTYALDHLYWSETRTWMALMMGAAMAVIMLGFMRSMYPSRAANAAIFVGSVLVFALALWLVRSQATVGQVDYMRAMVPHHSIAILTSERAQITDPRVRRLADEIIEAQRREIAEMKYLIKALSGDVATASPPRQPSTAPAVVPARDAVQQAAIEQTDLGELDEAEIDKLFGVDARCEFSYSRTSGPVVAATTADSAGHARGVIKLHGRLVELQMHRAGPVPATGLSLVADGIEVVVAAYGDVHGDDDDSGLRDAVARLRLDAGLDVAYGGFYGCTPPLH